MNDFVVLGFVRDRTGEPADERWHEFWLSVVSWASAILYYLIWPAAWIILNLLIGW